MTNLLDPFNICFANMENLKVLKAHSKALDNFDTESSLKMMKNAFYFTLKALFDLKICKFFSWLLVHVEKTARLEL